MPSSCLRSSRDVVPCSLTSFKAARASSRSICASNFSLSCFAFKNRRKSSTYCLLRKAHLTRLSQKPLTYDNVLKYLAAEYPSSFIQSLLAIHDVEIQTLPTELGLDPIRADALYFLPQLQQIVHLEFQTGLASTPPLPLRLLDYWVRLYRQYGYPIEQVVIFLKPTNASAVYVEQFAVGNTTHRYRVVRLWEQDPAPLLANPALLPLAVPGFSKDCNKVRQPWSYAN